MIALALNVNGTQHNFENVNYSIARIERRPDELMDNMSNHYRVMINRHEFYYSTGSAIKNAVIEDIMSCLISDYRDGSNYKTAKEFASDFGYDMEKDRALINNVWFATRQHAIKMRKIFNREMLEKLEEIFQDY